MKKICSNCEEENRIDSKYCSKCGYKLPVVEKIEEVKVEPLPRKKIAVNYKAIIGFIVGFIVMFFLTQRLFNPSIDNQMIEFSNEINRNCPINVDAYTILKNAIVLPNKTFQYNYMLVGVSKEEVNLEILKELVFPPILQNAKTNPDMKIIRDNQVTLKYYYTDENGAFVTEYVVEPEMYE